MVDAAATASVATGATGTTAGSSSAGITPETIKRTQPLEAGQRDASKIVKFDPNALNCEHISNIMLNDLILGKLGRYRI